MRNEWKVTQMNKELCDYIDELATELKKRNKKITKSDIGYMIYLMLTKSNFSEILEKIIDEKINGLNGRKKKLIFETDILKVD